MHRLYFDFGVISFPAGNTGVQMGGWFKMSTYESNVDMLAKYDALNGAALKTLVGSGTELIAYSDEILTAANEATTELLEENASGDAAFKEVYDS